jgi:hypothetical protein
VRTPRVGPAKGVRRGVQTHRRAAGGGRQIHTIAEKVGTNFCLHFVLFSSRDKILCVLANSITDSRWTREVRYAHGGHLLTSRGACAERPGDAGVDEREPRSLNSLACAKGIVIL